MQANVSAYEKYKQGHDAGNAASSYELGKMYYDGREVLQDYKTAADIWEHAAKLGNVDAMRGLANCYFRGHGRNEDNAKAKALFEKVLQLSPTDGESKLQIGKMYRSGWGVPQNHDVALKYFESAWKDGAVQAAVIIGDMFNYADKSTPAQCQIAAKYYQRGADAGDPEAIHELALCYEGGYLGFPQSTRLSMDLLKKNISYAPSLSHFLLEFGTLLPQEEASSYVQLALHQAEQGNQILQYTLGRLYRKGICVEQDFKQAEKWYCLSGDKNYLSPYTDLGFCYAFGYDGFPSDTLRAISYLKIAAECDSTYAMVLLGDIFEDYDVEISGCDQLSRMQAALHWQKMVADNVDSDKFFRKEASYKCSKKFFSGIGCNKDEKAGFYYLDLAGSLNCESAYMEIVNCCLWGKGTPPDYHKAHIYLQLAANYAEEQNSTWRLGEVEFYRGVMYENGFGVEKNYEEAIKHYIKAKEHGLLKAEESLKHFKKGLFGWKHI